MTKAMKAMKKYDGEKRPRGRPPAGAILVDGKWQLTELSMKILAERAQRTREWCREYSHNRWLARQARLRSSRPEPFAASRGIKTRQTTLAPKGRSMGRTADLIHCLNSDTSRKLKIDIYAAAPNRYLKKKAGSTEAGEEGEEGVSSSNSMEA